MRRSQQCDLGRGPGVVKGAFVALPRWFADTQRVQDLESRLLTCMQTLQGFDAAEIAKTPFGRGEQANIETLVAWISSESRGMKFALPQAPSGRAHDVRGRQADLLLPRRSVRLRLRDLPQPGGQAHPPAGPARPDLAKGAGTGFGAWPAYRVSSGELWGMQRRLNDCYRQQRFPYPGYASDATIALGVYMGVDGARAPSRSRPRSSARRPTA